MNDVSVIIVAGGIGSRMGSEIPKQFLPLIGKPMIMHSFEIFKTIPEVKEIVVVCEPEFYSLFDGALFAPPGPRRQDSFYNGFLATNKKNKLICSHDAARPLITKEMVKRTIDAAVEHGAAALGMPLKFTIKECDGKNLVVKTPDRSKYWEIQTPQVIQRDLLKKGFEKVIQEKLTVTDDVSIIELMGLPVKLVEGSYSNIKITTPEDLELAKQLIP